MKITKRIISLFLIVTILMSAAVYAADETDNPWTVLAENNGTVTVSDEGDGVTLECATERKTRAVAEALSPALIGGLDGGDINLSFTASFADFDANKRATVSLVSGEYSAELFTFTGTDSGITLKLTDGTAGETVLSSGEPVQFNTVLNLTSKSVRIFADGKELYSGTYDLLGTLDMGNLSASFKSIFTTSLKGSSTAVFENVSLAPGLFAGLRTDNTSCVVGVPSVINMTLPETGWEYAQVYANGTLITELPFGTESYEFNPKSAGTYNITVIIYDSYGNTAQAEISLEFVANELPSIAIEGIANGAEITLNTTDSKEFTINAYDSDGSIDRVEIYRYGDLIDTAYEVPYTGSLDDLGLCMGINPYKAVVYDNLGASASTSVSVLLTKYSQVSFLSETDFVKTGSAYGSGMSVAIQRGFAREETVDEEHGNSLVMGIDENTNTTDYTSGQYTFIQSPMNNNYTLYQLEFDINVIQPPAKDRVVIYGIRRNNGIVADIMQVGKTQLVFGSDKVDYTPGWNHVVITLSREIGNQYYSAEVNGELVASKTAIDLSDAPTNYRFFTTGDASNIGSVAIDNIAYSSLIESPRIIGVGTHSDIADGKISCDTREVGAFLSGTLLREDLTRENVHLYSGNAEIETELVRFNSNTNCIEITAAESFAPNTEYKIVLDGNVRFSELDELGLPMEVRFTTDHKGLTVDSLELSSLDDSLTIDAAFTNLDYSSKDIYVFVTFFSEEGRLLNTRLFKETLTADNTSNSFTFTVPGWDGAKPYVFITDGIMADRIYFAQGYDISEIETQAPEAEPVVLSIDQDPSDYTYFHSTHIINIGAKYHNSSIITSGGASCDAQRLDYTNPDKGENIVFTCGGSGEAYIKTIIESRAAFLPDGVGYDYYVAEGELMLSDPSVSGWLCKVIGAKGTEFAIKLDNGAICGNTGVILGDTLEADRWYNVRILLDFSRHLYHVVLDGKLLAENLHIPEDMNKLAYMCLGANGGSGSLTVHEWEFTGLAKVWDYYTDSEGNSVFEPVHSPQFPDDSVIEEYLGDKVVFHGDTNTIYKYSQKIPMSAQSVYKDNELYVPINDFNSAHGIYISYNRETDSYTDGDNTYDAPAPIESEEALLVPAEALSREIGYAAAHNGYGSMVICAQSADELIETSDKDYPWFDNQYTEPDKFTYPILSFTDAQEVSNYISFDRPTADRLKEDFYATLGSEPSHPRLLTDAAGVERMRKLIKTDDYYASMATAYIAQADKDLTASIPVYKFDDQMRTLSNANSFTTPNMRLAFAYLLTGDAKYADKAIERLMAVTEFPDINPVHIIDIGPWLKGISLTYDWCYDRMTDEQREIVECFIIEKGVKPVGRAYYAMLPSGGSTGFQLANWFPRWKSNYTPYLQGGLINACLAVADKDPDSCFDTLEKTFRAWEYMLFGLYPGGVWLEGKAYQGVVNSNLAISAGSLISTLGNTYGILDYPGVEESLTALMSYTSLSGSFSFADDTGRSALNTISDFYQFYADYYDNPQLSMWRQLAYNNEYSTAVEGARGACGIMDLLYYEPMAGMTALQDMQKVNAFEGGEIFTVHEDWLDKKALFFVSAGGPTRHYHHHNDGGDFLFAKDGVVWTYEFGQGNYNVGNIYTRYSGKTEAHNTLTILPSDGFSQRLESFADLLDYGELKGGAYAVYDMTELYEDQSAENITRGFYIGDNYESLTVRDEMEFSKTTSGYWFMQTEAEAEVVADNVVKLTKSGKTLYMTFATESDGFETEVYTEKSRPLSGSVNVEGDATAERNINRVALSFKGKGKIAVTVRMADEAGNVNTTPIAQW